MKEYKVTNNTNCECDGSGYLFIAESIDGKTFSPLRAKKVKCKCNRAGDGSQARFTTLKNGNLLVSLEGVRSVIPLVVETSGKAPYHKLEINYTDGHTQLVNYGCQKELPPTSEEFRDKDFHRIVEALITSPVICDAVTPPNRDEEITNAIARSALERIVYDASSGVTAGQIFVALKGEFTNSDIEVAMNQLSI